MRSFPEFELPYGSHPCDDSLVQGYIRDSVAFMHADGEANGEDRADVDFIYAEPFEQAVCADVDLVVTYLELTAR